MVKLGLGINAVAGALVGIPIIGFFVSSVVQKQGRTWVSLGSIDQFPEQATRMAVFINPYRNQADGDTAHIPCSVNRPSGAPFRPFAINSTHPECPALRFEH